MIGKTTKERSGGMNPPLLSFEEIQHLKFKNLLTGIIRRIML
jgi:hypothetical protein